MKAVFQSKCWLTFIGRDNVWVLNVTPGWPLTIATLSGLVHGDVGAVQAGHGLGVLHPHHEDDADSDEGEAGEDGDQNDEDRGDHHLPLALALATGVRHYELRRGLPQGEGVQGERLTDPLAIGGPHGDHVSVTRGQTRHQPLGLTSLQGDQPGPGLGVPQLESEHLPQSAVKARPA